jgi:hypothetical protein
LVCARYRAESERISCIKKGCCKAISKQVRWKVDELDGFSRKVTGPEVLVQEWTSSRSSIVKVVDRLVSSIGGGKDALGADFCDDSVEEASAPPSGCLWV